MKRKMEKNKCGRMSFITHWAMKEIQWGADDWWKRKQKRINEENVIHYVLSYVEIQWGVDEFFFFLLFFFWIGTPLVRIENMT